METNVITSLVKNGKTITKMSVEKVEHGMASDSLTVAPTLFESKKVYAYHKGDELIERRNGKVVNLSEIERELLFLSQFGKVTVWIGGEIFCDFFEIDNN